MISSEKKKTGGIISLEDLMRLFSEPYFQSELEIRYSDKLKKIITKRFLKF